MRVRGGGAETGRATSAICQAFFVCEGAWIAVHLDEDARGEEHVLAQTSNRVLRSVSTEILEAVVLRIDPALEHDVGCAAIDCGARLPALRNVSSLGTLRV